MSEQWYSLSEASRRLGYSRSYISLWIRRHGETLPKEMFFEIGGKKVISEQGIEFIKNNTKKLGDRLRNLTLKAVYKTKRPLCFYPTNHYIKIKYMLLVLT